MTIDERTAAAPGMGMPLKALEPVDPVCTLKRASRRAPQATNRKAAAQPSLPKGIRVHLYIITDGATPKATRSDRESSSTPKRVDVLVRRAIQPSRPSKIIAIMIAQAA